MFIKKIPMSRIREQYRKIKVNKKWLFVGLCLWIVSFLIDIWPILFLSFFCIANAILLSIDRYVNAPLDLELSTFSAVLMTKAYGLNWGIAVAVLTKLAAIFYNKNIRVDHAFMMVGYVISAFAASMIPGAPIVVGVIATLVVNLYTVFVSKFITMLSDYEIMMYGLSNTLFNIVMFIGFSHIFYGLMMLVR